MRGKQHVQNYSLEYATAYNKKLKGMVERKMRSAILSVGSFWFSAWVDAGQPDLDRLIKQPLSPEAKRNIKNEANRFKAK